jgi:hypothetical protein
MFATKESYLDGAWLAGTDCSLGLQQAVRTDHRSWRRLICGTACPQVPSAIAADVTTIIPCRRVVYRASKDGGHKDGEQYVCFRVISHFLTLISSTPRTKRCRKIGSPAHSLAHCQQPSLRPGNWCHNAMTGTLLSHFQRFSPTHLSPNTISRSRRTSKNAINVALNFERTNWTNGRIANDPFYSPPDNSSSLPSGSLLRVEEFKNTSTYTLHLVSQ